MVEIALFPGGRVLWACAIVQGTFDGTSSREDCSMVAKENFAPYAPAKAVMKVIQRYRDRGLPDTLTPKALEQIGVPGTMSPRTLAALKFLGLLESDGTRTEAFERLKRAQTNEYPGQFAE